MKFLASQHKDLASQHKVPTSQQVAKLTWQSYHPGQVIGIYRKGYVDLISKPQEHVSGI